MVNFETMNLNPVVRIEPVEFINPPAIPQANQQFIQIETAICPNEITFLNERTQPNLPDYKAVNEIPTKNYNSIPGTTFTEIVRKIYEETIGWKKNLFQVPSGKHGKDYIKLVTEWFKHFNVGNCFQGLSMKVEMILPNLLLQKPSMKSKAKDHTECLERRLKQWNEGKILDILKEGTIIQNKLKEKPARAAEDISRIFSKLMFEGKVGAALKFLDENSNNGVLKPTDEVVDKLKTMHPEAETILPNALINGPIAETSLAHFYDITEQQILKAASHTKGSGGPSLMDAKQWRRIICSSQFKAESNLVPMAFPYFITFLFF